MSLHPRWRPACITRRSSSGCRAREITQHFDSVSVCLSKGLGAPVGSVLCGSTALIAKARASCARWSAAACVRPGVLAAAGLYACSIRFSAWLRIMPTPARLGAALSELGYSVEPVQTNMVYVQLGERAGQIKAFMAERGIAVSAAPRLRLVTHLDVSAEQIERVIEAFAAFRSH
ncbi:beta-eliminating lyase-related protein [Ectopseudomonas oleovorans]|nr:beta-eliminating lyase-related protein [Pseudomonas oleovorans]